MTIVIFYSSSVGLVPHKVIGKIHLASQAIE